MYIIVLEQYVVTDN